MLLLRNRKNGFLGKARRRRRIRDVVGVMVADIRLMGMGVDISNNTMVMVMVMDVDIRVMLLGIMDGVLRLDGSVEEEA